MLEFDFLLVLVVCTQPDFGRRLLDLFATMTDILGDGVEGQ